jgi:hypothetical protein
MCFCAAKMKKQDIREYSDFKGCIRFDSGESEDRPAGILRGEDEA